MKGLMVILILSIFLIQFSSAICNLNPVLINQDPISAVPGETVNVIFQIRGTENPECSNINLEIMENYPFSLDKGYSKLQSIRGGTYQRDFNSFWLVPVKLRVDPNSLDGDQKISLKTWINSDINFAKISDFNISVKEVRTDFTVTIDSYSFSTKKLVIGLLNVGKTDARAITIQIPNQENALIEGGNIKILGELDSKEDTTTTFEADLNEGPIYLEIEYSDEIGVRRKLNKEVFFNDAAFNSTRAKSSISIGSIFLWLIVGGIIVYLFLSRRKARRHIQHLTKNK